MCHPYKFYHCCHISTHTSNFSFPVLSGNLLYDHNFRHTNDTSFFVRIKKCSKKTAISIFSIFYFFKHFTCINKSINLINISAMFLLTNGFSVLAAQVHLLDFLVHPSKMLLLFLIVPLIFFFTILITFSVHQSITFIR